jgi:hypothetical protein
MRSGLALAVALALLWIPGKAFSAEITEVLDAVDPNNPINIYLDVGFHSMLDRAKITHEWKEMWTDPRFSDRPDFSELRFQRQIYAMDYKFQIGLYHDLELYVNVPWIIQDKRTIGFSSGVDLNNSKLYNGNPTTDSLSVNPQTTPSTTRGGIGDMQVGFKWAPFNDERVDTESVWVIGLDYTIPSGKLAAPNGILSGNTGSVGLGQHVITPFMLFSRRFSVLDPYIGLQGSIPIQGREARNAGFKMPYHGGFLTGMELVPWENKEKHQKFAIDIRLTTEFFGEVESKGDKLSRGTESELSDFLVSHEEGDTAVLNPNQRQLQAVGEYTQFGLHLGFVIRAAEYVRFRFGVSLAHNTEHFITGADPCINRDGDSRCEASVDQMNPYRTDWYDDPGHRIRVEETTIFTYWLTGMLTF